MVTLNLFPALAIFSFFLFASGASFTGACASRITKSHRAGWDNPLLPLLSGRSRCDSCRTPLAIRDLIPVFSCLFLRGRCRCCGAYFGWKPFFFESIAGLTGVASASFLLPLWEVHSLFGALSALILFAGLSSFLFLSAITDFETGFVWDFPALSGAVLSTLFLCVAGGLPHFLLFCAVGWTTFLVSMTGWAGQGDAAPLSSALAVAMTAYSVNPLSLEAFSVGCIFLFIMSVSALFHAGVLAAKRREERLLAKLQNRIEKEDMEKLHIPLVPHIAVAFTAVLAVAAFTGGQPLF